MVKNKLMYQPIRILTVWLMVLMLMSCNSCTYEGTEYYFLEKYASIMDDRYYKGDAAFNRNQLDTFGELTESLRTTDPDYVWTAQVPNSAAGIPKTLEERNTAIHSRTDDQKNFDLKLALYHAPLFYQDMQDTPNNLNKKENESAKVIFSRLMNVNDFPTPLFLNEGNNVSQNSNLLTTIAQDLKALAEIIPTVYYKVRESESHFFLTYVLYYPRNNFDGSKYQLPGVFPSPQSFNHDQDIEYAFMAVRKNVSSPGGGTLELIATFRHGIMHLFHPEGSIQKQLRRAFGDYLTKKDLADVVFGPLYQPHAIRHDTSKAPVFRLDKNGNRMGIHLYSPRFGHALNGADLEAWRNGYGSGLILIPESTSLKAVSYDFESQLAKRGIRPYQLLSWDTIMDQHRINRNVFVGELSFEFEMSDGVIKARDGSPNAIIQGPSEKKPETTLPEAASGRTPFPMAVPHKVLGFFHTLLGKESYIKSSISDHYLYNPDVQYTTFLK